MKLDRKTAEKLIAMPDDKLAGLCVLFAARHGLRPQGTLKPESVRRLRAVLGMLTDGDLERLGALAEASENKGGAR